MMKRWFWASRAKRYTLTCMLKSGFRGLLLQGNRPYVALNERTAGNVTTTILEPMGADCAGRRLGGVMGGYSRLAEDEAARPECRRLHAMDGDERALAISRGAMRRHRIPSTLKTGL